jgi:hypothetical protein
MRSLCFLLSLAAVTGVATRSEAYVQTMTCNPDGGLFACSEGETPKPVHWPQRCILFYVNDQGSTDIPSSTGPKPELLTAIDASFQTWTDVSQSDMTVEYAGLTNEDRAEFVDSRGDEGNANVVVFRDEEWPYASSSAFAITSVTFDPSTGVISDADIELNGRHHTFTVGDRNIRVDVQNTLTHEAGHFIGFDHTPVPDATMFGMAPEGETQKRTLHADDIEGLAQIYPPGDGAPQCPDAPAFFEKPLKDDDKGCCAVVNARPGRSALPWLFSLAGVVVAFRRMKRRRDR